MQAFITPPPRVRTVWQELPGRAMTAVALTNSTIWLIVDPEKLGGDGTAGQLGNLVHTLLDGFS